MSLTASEGALGWHRSQACCLEELVPTGEWQQHCAVPQCSRICSSMVAPCCWSLQDRHRDSWAQISPEPFGSCTWTRTLSFFLPSPIPGPCAFVDALSHATDAERVHSYAAPRACCSDFIITPLKYPPGFDTLTLLYNSLLLIYLYSWRFCC